MVKASDISRFIVLTREAVYDHTGLKKEEYKKLGRKILREIVKMMNLPKGEYEIRWNPGGIACSGDHILHTPWFYLSLDDNIGMGWFYYRSCKGMQDYTGGSNNIVDWREFQKNGLPWLVKKIEMLRFSR